MIDLEFDSPSEAEAMRETLRRDVWGSRRAPPALIGSPQARIVEAVESKEYKLQPLFTQAPRRGFFEVRVAPIQHLWGPRTQTIG